MAAAALGLTALAALLVRARRRSGPALREGSPLPAPPMQAESSALEIVPAAAAPVALQRASLRERLGKTQAALVGRALRLVGARTLDAELEGELEALLF
ncbi:MAG: hypothetical protein ACHQ6V_20220, partial [Myxococcota bacterium]